MTQRVISQRLIQANQENLAQAQALSHVGSWEWDVETGTETWSDEQFRIFGYSPHIITPTINTFHDAIHPDDRARVFKAVEDTLQQNRLYEVTCRIIRPSGESRYVLCRGTVARDIEGRPKRMTGTVQDITEGKDIEYRLLLTPCSGWTLRRDRSAPASGITTSPKIGWSGTNGCMNCTDIRPRAFLARMKPGYSRLHPEDKMSAEAAVQAALEGRSPFDTEFRLILPNMIIRHIKASAVVLRDEAGNAVRMIGINYDITGRKTAERELAQAAQEAERRNERAGGGARKSLVGDPSQE